MITEDFWVHVSGMFRDHGRGDPGAGAARGGGTRLGCLLACATLAGMSTDSRPSAADTRQASLVPGKPSLDGIEEKWSRRWEEGRVVQV
jgi:hypothetical protein